MGKNVKKLGASMCDGCSKLRTLQLNTKKLTKKNVTGSLKDSAVKTVKVPAGKVDSYKKIFTKTNAGKKVNVKSK